MSLGPLMVDIAGTELSAEDVRVLSHPLVGSVILFTRNYRDPAATRRPHGGDPRRAHAASVGRGGSRRGAGTALPRGVYAPAGRAAPGQALSTRTGASGLALAQSVGWLMASELRAVGVDFSFAPCVDLDYGVSEIIGDRAFHSDPDAVGGAGRGQSGGHARGGDGGDRPSIFPGHGAVVADSHVALPVDRREFADLEADIRPYRPLIDNNVAGIMAAHVVFPAVDALPASLSKRWITGVLRGELGFHGCVFADDLSMAGAAAFGDVVERAELALAAGCDVLPICND